MKERPIPFSGDMVRAILEGRKTMTRRPVKPRYYDYIQDWDNNDKNYGPWFEDEYGDWHETAIKCPYGQLGDRLWVRETFAPISIGGAKTDFIHYKATPNDGRFLNKDNEWVNEITLPWLHKWKSPLFMPRWASRITLEIVKVRVERLQEISHNDWVKDFCPHFMEIEKALQTFIGSDNQRDMAKSFWNSLYPKKPELQWQANPWVWVIEFKPCQNSVKK